MVSEAPGHQHRAPKGQGARKDRASASSRCFAAGLRQPPSLLPGSHQKLRYLSSITGANSMLSRAGRPGMCGSSDVSLSSMVDPADRRAGPTVTPTAKCPRGGPRALQTDAWSQGSARSGGGLCSGPLPPSSLGSAGGEAQGAAASGAGG